ncbi:MAG: sulfurtransferase, partial [Microbacterium sp.]
SFCTGGIRCEKAAIYLREDGINALQLDGGILGYFEQVGHDHYDGDCFVFDEREALAPDLTPRANIAS